MRTKKEELFDGDCDGQMLRNQEDSRTGRRLDERGEMARHGPGVVRHENSVFCCRKSQYVGIFHPREIGFVRSAKIDGGLSAKNPQDDGLIEIRVRLEA